MSIQKLLYLFEKLNKDSFKGKKLIFEKLETPPPPQQISEDKKTEKEKKATIAATAADTQEAGADAAGAETTEDPLEAELKSLDQAKFDKILESINEAKQGDKALTAAQVEVLVNFAKSNLLEKNLEKIWTAIAKAKITADQLTVNSIKVIVEYVKNDPSKFTKLFAVLTKNSTTASNLIEAVKDQKEFIKEVYDIIKETEVLKSIKGQSLAILINNLGAAELLTKISDEQKADCLGSTALEKPKKEIILENLSTKVPSLSKYDQKIIEAIVLYVTKEAKEHLSTTLTQKLDQAAIEKLTVDAALALLNNLDKKGEQLYTNLLKYLPLTVKEALLAKKDLSEELKKAINDSLTAEQKRELEDKAKKVQAKEKFKPNITPEEMLEAAGLKSIKRGKSVGWDFSIDMGNGETIVSERSFLKTKRFLKELTKKDTNGNLVYDTPEKVRLCAYKWLWEQVYKKGEIGDKYKVAEFEKSQEILQTEITKLEAAPKDEPTVAAEPPKAAPGTPATPESGKGTPPETTEPGAPEKAAPAGSEPPSPAGSPAASTEPPAAETPARTRPPEPESGTAGRKEKEKTPYQKAVEAFNERVKKKLEELQKIADKVADERTESVSPEKRTIKINTEPKKIPYGEIYTIEIDGKKSQFTLAIYKDLNSTKTEFSFFRKNKQLYPYEEHSAEKITDTFVNMLAETPNERSVKDFDTAIKELQKGIGGYKTEITSKGPKTLTVYQYKVLETSQDSIIRTISEGENVLEILKTLKKIAENVQPILLTSSIEKIKFLTKPRIVWKPKNKINPFGEEGRLSDTILAIKKAQLPEDEYEKFVERTKKAGTEAVAELDSAEKITEYRAKYLELTQKPHPTKIGNLYEEDMVSKWEKMNGFRRVEQIMQASPWSLHKEAVPKTAARIISEGSNSEVYFADVFKSIKEIPAFTKKGLGVLLEKGPDKFMEIFERLLKEKEAGTLTNKSSLEELDLMFNEVIVPCLNLIEAFKELEPPKEKDTKKKEKEQELPREQQEILKALTRLCDFESEETDGWSKFLVSLSGGKTGPLTMSDMDGNLFTVARGRFRDHYSAKAALTILTNINEDKNNDGEPDHYHYENGVKMFNKDAILDEINERIILGVTNIVMAEAGQKGQKLEGEDLASQVKTRLVDYLVTDLTKITPEQIKAFQLGFVLKEARQFAQQVEEGKKAVAESAEDPTIKNHPLFKKVASDLLDKGISPDKVKKIQEKLLLAAGASFKNGRFEGGVVGTRIPIGDGLDVLIGLGATVDGQFIAGIGLNITVYQGNTVKASIITEIGLTGVTLGAAQTFKPGYVNIHTFEGVRWSWDSIIPTVGGSFGFSWDTEGQLDRDLKAAEGQTDYSKVWEEWKSMSQSDIEGKFAKLQKIPQIWRRIEPLMKEFDLTKADIVNMIEGIKEQITRDVLANLKSPIPIFSYIGFGMLGPIPIPLVGIKLGSAEITVPNRRAIAKILEELSDIRVTSQLKKAVEAMEKGEKTPIFYEQTGKLIYGRDGQLLTLIKSDQIDLKNWQTSIETYNTQLKRVEISLKQNPNGTIELQVHGTDRKDVEIHLDRELEGLALIKDGSKILIEGNIDDLIISRERFALPFEATEGSATMRDIVTIRQRSSVKADRDSTWIQRYESAFLQKLEDESEFSVMNGNNHKRPQDNLLELTGYADKKPEELMAIDKAAGFIEKRPKLAEKLDRTQLEAMQKHIEARQKALLEKGKAMKTEEYEKLQIRENLFTDLDKLWDKTAFRKEFRTKIDEPETLVQILTKHADKTDNLKNLNEKEINLAIMHLINRHFTNIYAESTKRRPDGTDKLQPAEIRKINARILKHMEAKIRFVRDRVLIPAFKDAIENIEPNPTNSPETLVDKLIKDTYDPLRTKLKGENFDFRNIKVEDIPGGAYLFSGSRLYNRRGKIEGAPAQHVSYETLPRNTKLLLGFGFLEGTTGKYSLTASDSAEKELARVILEISSPLPKEDLEFLNSPLALKFAGLKSFILLSYNDKTKFDDYQKITEIYNDTNILNTSQPHKEALERYKKLINEIRASQLNGTTFEKKIGNTGLTVRIKIDTDITRGAYSKCSNPSFSVQETGKIEVLKDNKIIAQFNMTNEVIDAELSKIFVSFGIGIGLRSEKTPPPKQPPQPPAATPKPQGTVHVGPVGAKTPGGAPPAPAAEAHPSDTSGEAGLD